MHVGFEAAFQNLTGMPDDVFLRKEISVCVDAESYGFDSLWVTEHHFSDYGLIGNPLQLLSYVAGRTGTIKLGTAVLVLPWHDPLRLAEQILLADHLSDGRLVVGVGRGLSREEFEGLRVPIQESRVRFEECAALLLAALETGVIEGGEMTRQPRRELRPRPSRSFSGRIFSASVSPESAPLMARLGLGSMHIMVKPLELIAQDVDRHRQTWSQVNGGSAPRPLLSANVVVDPSRDRALELAKKYHRASHRLAVRHYGMGDPAFGGTKSYEFYRAMRDSSEPDLDLPPASVIYGTPDDVLRRFEELHKALDLQGVLTIFHGMPEEDGLQNIRLFVDNCLPELKSWPTENTF
ncbi:LLM class flavin-dependent oxidoreductase [Micromonospora sp. CA-249363]|uniref:LLM class flavin-dependent oxidoreductase n=1 Tax=Micromonospora sp. CA-249363 TaxID=3239963 RepID=UPI003D8E2B19